MVGSETLATRVANEPQSVGHSVTFFFVAVFAFAVYFRPHEFYPTVPVIRSLPMFSAIGALASFFASELMRGGLLGRLSVEVKCLYVMGAFALISMPIARDPGLAWERFNDPFLPLLLVFFVTTNVLTTLRRVRIMMYLGVAIGIYLSYQTYDLYSRGIFEIEGYRIVVDYGGMFGNPNDMSLHLVMFVPIAIGLAFFTTNFLFRTLLLAGALLMLVAVTLTQSRSGLIGIATITIALLSRLGRGRKTKAFALTGLFLFVLILSAPGNIGMRIVSIFDSTLDASGSYSQRQDALTRSIVTTIRNPLGVGLGNSVTYGPQSLETHNAYTQVSSELGWLAFAAYLVLIFYPLRSLSRIEKELFPTAGVDRVYYLVVATWAAIIGYVVSSFFASVAYLWFVYYPIAFAIGLRRLIPRVAEMDRSSIPVSEGLAASDRRNFGAARVE